MLFLPNKKLILASNFEKFPGVLYDVWPGILSLPMVLYMILVLLLQAAFTAVIIAVFFFVPLENV